MSKMADAKLLQGRLNDFLMTETSQVTPIELMWLTENLTFSVYLLFVCTVYSVRTFTL